MQVMESTLSFKDITVANNSVKQGHQLHPQKSMSFNVFRINAEDESTDLR